MIVGRDGRVLPEALVPRLIVRLLDRLPEIRDQVLSAYWSPSEIEKVKRDADEMFKIFGKKE